MRYKGFIGLSIIFILSCQLKAKQALDETIISDSFLSLIDTTAYRLGSLLPANEGNPEVGSPRKQYIIIDTVLRSMGQHRVDAIAFIESKPSYAAYRSLLAHKEPPASIAVQSITDPGPYKVVATSSGIYKNNILGRISFSKCHYDVKRGLAAYIATLSTGPKAGVVWLALLERKNNKWMLQCKEPLERW